MKLGKITNQQFTQISFGSLRETLEGLCGRYGMRYIGQEESYTSKASCLDLDDIPVYKPGSRILEPSAENVSIVDCTSLLMAGLLTPT